MRIPRIIAVLFLLAIPWRGSSAEEAKDLLKVPPAADRPVDEGGGEKAKQSAAPESLSSPPKAEPEPEKPVPPSVSDAEESRDREIVPAAYPVSRYASLWENSPFQLESIAPPVESAGLAQRFVLGGILRENGEYIVWVRERATQQSHKVDKKGGNSAGLSLVEVSESPEKQSDASATIRLGAEIGVIKFDAAAAPPAIAGLPASGVPPAPNFATRQLQQAQRSGVPAAPTVAGRPGVPPASPQQGSRAYPVSAPGIVPPVPGPGVPGSGQTQVAPGQSQPAPPLPRVIRRRAIVPAAP